MRWISINELKRMVKQKFYQLETGSKKGDYLVYDRYSKSYVGHIEGAMVNEADEIDTAVYYEQNKEYIPNQFIFSQLESFKNTTDWDNGTQW